MDIVEIYLLFNISCTINGLKSRGMGGYPIYDIVRMCVPKSPLFQSPKYMINPLFFKKKKVYEYPDFWNWNGPNFLTPMYMLIVFAHIPVKPLISHLHKAGFLVMRVMKRIYRVYKCKEQFMNRSTFCESKYMNRLFFFKGRYVIGVSFKILTRTPIPKLLRSPLSLSVHVNCVQLYSLLQVVLIMING